MSVRPERGPARSKEASDAFYATLSDPKKGFECKDPSYLEVGSGLNYVGFDVNMELNDEGNKVIYIYIKRIKC